MPKCEKCGKRFQSLTALRDHYRAVHPAERFVAPTTSSARNLVVGLVIVIIIVGAIVGYLIYLQESKTTTTINTAVLNQPISQGLYQDLSGVSFSTLSLIGSGQGVVNPPTAIAGTPLTSTDGRPEILYIGAEFCPYCAAERWSLVVALSKFGNFSNLEYMQSAPNDGNIATLSFRDATYTSPYVSFVTVENEDRNHNQLQPVTSEQQQLWNTYNPNAYPFVDIGGNYVIRTSQFSYSILSNLNWTQIGSQLNTAPSGQVAKGIDGAANTLITAICKIDGGKPGNVCGQSFAKLSFMIPLGNPGSPFITAHVTLAAAVPLSSEATKRFVFSGSA